MAIKTGPFSPDVHFLDSKLHLHVVLLVYFPLESAVIKSVTSV